MHKTVTRVCPPQARLRRSATSGSNLQPKLQAAIVHDIATQHKELEQPTATPRGAVTYVEKAIEWKPMALPNDRIKLDHAKLFTSHSTLNHTHDDLGAFTMLDRTSAFAELFYHNGFFGRSKQFKELKTAAIMVRQTHLDLRDELLWRADQGLGERHSLAESSGLVVCGQRGFGKSMALNYAAAACHEAGWLVVTAPHASDWTLGFGATSAQSPNEAYRLSNPDYFKMVPPALQQSRLYESPTASTAFLIGNYLSSRRQLEKLPIKCALADFPVPARPVHDFLCELQTVTDVPVLLVVDEWNRWQQMATSMSWNSPVPLHSSQLLVPSMLGSLEYGRNMANGMMLCGVTESMPKPPRVPHGMRSRFAPVPTWFRPHELPQKYKAATRHVPSFSTREVQRMLEFYAHVGHLRKLDAAEALETGELAAQLRLLSAGCGEDLYLLSGQV